MLLTPEQIEALGGLESREQRRENGTRDWGNRSDRNNRGGFEEAHGSNREEFMQRFDSNGDGTIDESERSQIREFFRNGGGDRGGSQGGNSGGRPSQGTPPPSRP